MDTSDILKSIVWAFTLGFLQSGFVTSLRVKRQNDPLDSFCVQRQDGQIFPDPDDCKSYIFCNAGYAYKSACAPGLYYDHRLQTCDFDNGQCTGPSGRRNELPGENVPNADFSNQGNFASSASNPTRASTKVDVGTLSSLSEFCKNRRDGTFPHPYDCHSYILCSNQVSFSTTCPDKLIYNVRTDGCDFDIEGICSSDGG